MTDAHEQAKPITLEDMADAVMTLPPERASEMDFYREGKYCGYGWAAHQLWGWTGEGSLPEELQDLVRDAEDRGFYMTGMVFSGAYGNAMLQALSHEQCVEAAKQALAERLREAAR